MYARHGFDVNQPVEKGLPAARVFLARRATILTWTFLTRLATEFFDTLQNALVSQPTLRIEF